MKLNYMKIKLNVILTYQNKWHNDGQELVTVHAGVDTERSAYGVWKDIVKDILCFVRDWDADDLVLIDFCYYEDENVDAPMFAKKITKEALLKYGGRVLLHHGVGTDYRDEVTKDILKELNFDVGYKEKEKVA